MIDTRLGAMALALCCAPSLAGAQDLTWGCTFDRFSGVTTCLEIATDPLRNTGNLLVSQPNVGIPGTSVSVHGETVEVYLGGNGTGYQSFHWEE